MSKFLISAEVCTATINTDNNTCNNENLCVGIEKTILPTWWSNIKAVQILNKEQK